MRSVNSMVKRLHNLLYTQTTITRDTLTPWEQTFVKSIWSRSEEGANTARLTEKQVEIVPELYRKYFGD